MDNTDVEAAEHFIGRWKGSAASELSTSQSFLIDLCELLGVDRPHATPQQDYMFERPLTFHHGDGSTSAGRVDLYRRGAFILESKKLKAGGRSGIAIDEVRSSQDPSYNFGAKDVEPNVATEDFRLQRCP